MPESKIKRLLLPAGLVVGGVTVGSFIAPLGLASAQTDDSDSADPDTSELEADAADDTVDDVTEGRRGGRGHRGGHHGRHGHGKGFGPGGEAVAETLGLTKEEVREGLAAGQSLADLATAQGVEVADLIQAMIDAANVRIDEALADGKIDEDRATDMKADVADRVDNLVNSTPEELQAEREALRAERQAEHEERRAERTALLEEVLGLSGDEIQEALSSGSTLADLAAEQDVSEDDLAAALVENALARVDEDLAEGKIDEDRAAAITDGIEDRIDDLIANGRPERGERGRGHGPGDGYGFGRGHGPGDGYGFGRGHGPGDGHGPGIGHGHGPRGGFGGGPRHGVGDGPDGGETVESSFSA